MAVWSIWDIEVINSPGASSRCPADFSLSVQGFEPATLLLPSILFNFEAPSLSIFGLFWLCCVYLHCAVNVSPVLCVSGLVPDSVCWVDPLRANHWKSAPSSVSNTIYAKNAGTHTSMCTHARAHTHTHTNVHAKADKHVHHAHILTHNLTPMVYFKAMS